MAEEIEQGDAASEEAAIILRPGLRGTGPGFSEWLAASGGALAFTSYQTGRLVFVGSPPEGGAAIGQELAFSRAMGLGFSADLRQMYLATQHQIYRFDNFLPSAARHADGSDAVFVPRLSWITGDLDAHDIGAMPGGRPVFINTAFNCLATVSPGYSFRPLWRPDFISALVAEDRCHLNGLAMENGRPRYLTAVASSDQAGGWRAARDDGGLVFDLGQEGRVIARGLSMPHSPRLYRGRLWLLNSGRGELGWIDTGTGEFHPVAFCPGYSRGLAFAGDYALVGLSLPREGGSFHGLALDARLDAHGLQAQCGIAVIDLAQGRIVTMLHVGGRTRELYDLAFLPGLRNPRAVGFRTDEIRHLIALDDGATRR